MMTDIPFT